MHASSVLFLYGSGTRPLWGQVFRIQFLGILVASLVGIGQKLNSEDLTPDLRKLGSPQAGKKGDCFHHAVDVIDAKETFQTGSSASRSRKSSTISGSSIRCRIWS
ncbi:MAG TPA: hypothetical protein VGL91_17265, partial [Acidobacteriota bacterium]